MKLETLTVSSRANYPTHFLTTLQQFKKYTYDRIKDSKSQILKNFCQFLSQIRIFWME